MKIAVTFAALLALSLAAQSSVSAADDYGRAAFDARQAANAAETAARNARNDASYWAMERSFQASRALHQQQMHNMQMEYEATRARSYYVQPLPRSYPSLPTYGTRNYIRPSSGYWIYSW